jgi:hypothetical protein
MTLDKNFEAKLMEKCPNCGSKNTRGVRIFESIDQSAIKCQKCNYIFGGRAFHIEGINC